MNIILALDNHDLIISYWICDSFDTDIVSVYWLLLRCYRIFRWIKIIRITVTTVWKSVGECFPGHTHTRTHRSKTWCPDSSIEWVKAWKRRMRNLSVCMSLSFCLCLYPSLFPPSVQLFLSACIPIWIESVSIQLAQCRFPGLAISNAKI